jgi:hypothetical protein
MSRQPVKQCWIEAGSEELRRLRWQRGIGVSGCWRIGVGLGKIGKFLAQMGAAAGGRGTIKKLRHWRVRCLQRPLIPERHVVATSTGAASNSPPEGGRIEEQSFLLRLGPPQGRCGTAEKLGRCRCVLEGPPRRIATPRRRELQAGPLQKSRTP